jgi:hypothetical protein
MRQRYFAFLDFISGLLNMVLAIIFWPVRFIVKPIPEDGDSRLLHILANGPSLLDDIEKSYTSSDIDDTMSMNYFALSKEFHRFKPTKYVLVDPVFFKGTKESEIADKNKRLLAALSGKHDWDFSIFIPWNYRNSQFAIKLKKRHQTKLHLIPNLPLWGGSIAANTWIVARGLATPPFQNVLVASIYLGIKMRYDQIHLYGVDHSWLKNMHVGQDNKLYSDPQHYYGTAPTGLHKTSFGTEISLLDELVTLSHAFKSYHILNRWAKNRGVSIINHTTGSWIDAFERIDHKKP